MINIPFDQYQRYKMTQIYIEELRDKNNLKILEVGANEHKNLKKFLPNDSILYLDIYVPEHLKDDDEYLEGDATDLQFQENEFDFIVALDVYEHIPADLRRKFLRELSRVGKNVILSAPFKSENGFVEEYESRVNKFYKILNGIDNKWLKEHKENELPDLYETEKTLKTINKNYFLFKHGNLEIWEKMFKIHFLDEKMKGIYSFYREEADKYYNNNIFSNDFKDQCYRTFIIITEKELKHKKIIEDCKIDDRKIHDILDEFRMLYIKNDSTNKCILNNEVMQVFYNIGNGINENDSIKKVYTNNEITFQLKKDLVDSTIRIDPGNLPSLVVFEELEFYSNEKKINYNYSFTNGMLLDKNIFIFYSSDPQIYIQLQENYINTIKMKCKIIPMEQNLNLFLFINIIKNQQIFLKEKDSKINSVEKLLENKEIQLFDIDKQLQKCKATIQEKEEEINEYKVNMREKEEKINEYKVNMREKEEEINQYKVNMREKEEEINEYKVNMREKEEEINQCKVNIREKEEEINAYKVNIKEKEEEINAYKVNIKEKEEEINEHKVTLKEKEERINDVQNKLCITEKELNDNVLYKIKKHLSRER